MTRRGAEIRQEPGRQAIAGLLPVALVVLVALSPVRGDDFPIRIGDRIVFFGDSITQKGTYATYVEAYLWTRFPARRIEVVNRGLSSETISGTSETDHLPRRANASDRFDRDVDAVHPALVVSCFGMNDGNYHPFDEERFKLFRAGISKLIEKTAASQARLTILTPPPFDPYQRKATDPNAKEYGYKYPAIDYDRTLDRYAEWLRRLRGSNFSVIDLHTALNDHLAIRRRSKVSFHLAEDAVHPNETGHALMAIALLKSWNAPAFCSELTVTPHESRSGSESVDQAKAIGTKREMVWRTNLPAPHDPVWDRESINLEAYDDSLNRHILKATGFEGERIRVTARIEGDERTFTQDFDRKRLETGINLATIPDFPTTRRSDEFLVKLTEINEAIGVEWRWRVHQERKGPYNGKTFKELSKEKQALRALAEPVKIAITIEPLL